MPLTATILAAENNPILPHTYELVVGVFSFLVVFLVVGKMLVPRIQKTLEERTEAIEGGIKRAEEAQAEAQRALGDQALVELTALVGYYATLALQLRVFRVGVPGT